jgi:hypothetical protein
MHEDLTPSDVQLPAMKGLLGHRDAATAVIVHHGLARWQNGAVFNPFEYFISKINP